MLGKVILVAGGIALAAVGVAQMHSITQAPGAHKPSADYLATQARLKAAEDLRWKTAVTAGRQIKRALTDPDSVQWDLIHVSRDASIVCLEYRAKNGFGGYVREYTTVRDGQFLSGPDAWNKTCVGAKLHDVGLAKRAI